MTMMTIAICDDMQADARRLTNSLTTVHFLRCHQSFIVNMERVTGAENNSFHIGEHVIPISRSYNRNAHEKYDEYLRLQQEYDEEEED